VYVVRHRSTERTMAGRVALGAHGAYVRESVGRDSTEAETQHLRETPEQRFDRLMRILDGDGEFYCYEEALDLEDTYLRLMVGSLVCVDCELEVPSPIRLLAQPEEVGQTLDLTDVIRHQGVTRHPMGRQNLVSMTGFQRTSACKSR
jgi:hypothetical protein